MAPRSPKKSTTRLVKLGSKQRQKQFVIEPSIIFFIITILVLFGGVVFGLRFMTTQKDVAVYKVGVMLPFTGDSATLGNSLQKAASLAIKDSKVENIKLVQVDSTCSAEGTIGGIQQLIEDGVIAVIGDVCSGGTLAALPAAEKSKIPIISPGSTSVQLDNKSDYFFRTIPSDAGQVKYAAQLLYHDGKRNIAIVYSDEPYGIGFAQGLQTEFSTLGGNIVAATGFPQNDVAVDVRLTQLLSKNPDAVFIVSNSDALSSASIKKIRSISKTVPIYGSEALKSKSFLDDTGSDSEGLLVVSIGDPTATFVENFTAEYGETPDQYAPEAYDAMTAVIKAIQSGATDGEGVKNALKKTDFDGYSGRIKFKASGAVEGNYVTFVIRKGVYEKR